MTMATKAWVEFRIFGGNDDFSGHRWPFLHQIIAGIAHFLPGEGGNFAGYADDGSAAGNVGDDVDAEHRVAQNVLHGRAGLVFTFEDHDAFVVVTETQLFFGT